jgi:hypothetical protein
MTLAEFKVLLKKAKPPSDLSPALRALWWAAKDKWDEAHRIVMNEGGKDCAWVHAYLHRVEGDLDNARYWYRQARRSAPASSLAEEWSEIATNLLKAN